MSEDLTTIRNKINELEYYYNEFETENRLIKCKINNKTYLLEKKEIISLLKMLIDDENLNINSIKFFIEKLKVKGGSSYEMSTINLLKNEVESYSLNSMYNISIIKNNNNISIVKNNISAIIQQCNHFDCFKNNQDIYDNMISIIKIINRLQNQNISINYKNFVFNSENDNSDNLKNKIMLESIKRFEGIRFLI